MSPRLPFNPSCSYFNYSSLLRTPFFSCLVICFSALASNVEAKAGRKAKAKRKRSRKIKCCNLHKQSQKQQDNVHEQRKKIVCPSLRLFGRGLWQFVRIAASRNQGRFVTLQPVPGCFLRRQNFDKDKRWQGAWLLTECELCRYCQRSIEAHPNQSPPGIMKLQCRITQAPPAEPLKLCFCQSCFSPPPSSPPEPLQHSSPSSSSSSPHRFWEYLSQSWRSSFIECPRIGCVQMRLTLNTSLTQISTHLLLFFLTR
jgi:hypothetical protein